MATKKKRKKTYVYMQITKDEYEFPILTCDSLDELAERTGIRKNTIASTICKWEKGIHKKSGFIRVSI